MGMPDPVAGVDGGLCTGLGAITSVADKADSAFRAGATAPEAVSRYGSDLPKRSRRCHAQAHIGRDPPGRTPVCSRAYDSPSVCTHGRETVVLAAPERTPGAAGFATAACMRKACRHLRAMH